MRLDTTSAKLFFSTVKLLINDSSDHRDFGTGFFFWYDSNHDGPKFMVTAKHVIENAQTGYFFWNESDGSGYPMMGSTIPLDFEEFSTLWTPHPDETVDVAVMPLEEPRVEAKIKETGRVPLRIFLEDEIILSPEDSRAIERVLFVGYPDGRSDIVNFTPFARGGTTATPYELNFNGMPAFLIDASVYSGSSGSPVCISRGTEPHFLGGVLSESMYVKKEIESKKQSTDTKSSTQAQGEVKMEIGLGIVYRAHTIVETVEHCLKQHSL